MPCGPGWQARPAAVSTRIVLFALITVPDREGHMWTLVALCGSLAPGQAPVTPAPLTPPIFPGQGPPVNSSDQRAALPTLFGTLPPAAAVHVPPDARGTTPTRALSMIRASAPAHEAPT